MKIIVPMAGQGKRMRPHTLTVPKPLIPIAGKSIVKRLVDSIAEMTNEPIEEVAYVIGHFGEEVETQLKTIAEAIGAKGTIHYQKNPLGTGHAVLCADPALDDRVVIAFADTLFNSDFTIDAEQDGIIWVKRVENPSAFGVVQANEEGTIQKFIEKPQEHISDQAIIGIYYFKDGKWLKDELQYLLDHDIKGNGEYQLTDAMENMKNKGAKLKTGEVNQWMDCGNKDATIDTNKRILDLVQEKEQLVAPDVEKNQSIIIEPCYIGNNVKINQSVIGPYVSISNDTVINNSIIADSMVFANTTLEHVNCQNTMIGSHAVYKAQPKDLSIGDYSKIMD